MGVSQQPDTKVEEGRDGLPTSDPEQGKCCLSRICNSPTWRRRAPPPRSYPPISSIPKTSPERLALASDPSASAAAKTILYLAYGSNLSAETFLGARGIRPLSQINVSAPAFDLCFDLPGIPYSEPCFANTRPRKIPKPPVPVPIPGDPPKFPPPPPYKSSLLPSPSLLSSPSQNARPTWSKGLYGVVYEVTPEDYAKIIKTEGGGQGYHDVLTPCFELPPPLHVPEKPPIPELPRPFLAHTLYAPSLPDLPDKPGDDGDTPKPKPKLDDNNGDNGDGDDDDDNDPLKQPWLRRLLLPVHRPDPNYAQASPRYMKLIRDGAREHGLPDDYQAYLAAFTPYEITRFSQQVGRILFILAAAPVLLLMLGLGRLLADETGRTPRWLGVATTMCMNLLWALYDAVFKPVFGDGERTMSDDEGDEGGRGGSGRRLSVVRRNMGGMGEEKNRLLSDW
ncbi:hypothetical protein GGR51DRAFT_152902 [Nemania sp. FL0031]|nr:hypothetical protein GGR51DRAFT_152902 [Nemania sp. FL0031]